VIVTLPGQNTCAIRFRCSPERMAERVPEALAEVRSVIEARGLGESGFAYTRYLGHFVAEGVFELEVGVPVDEPAPGEGRVEASTLPAGRAVQLSHHGDYAALGESHARLPKLVEELGERPSGAPWESYVTGPGDHPDPARWVTLLVQPIGEGRA